MHRIVGRWNVEYLSGVLGAEFCLEMLELSWLHSLSVQNVYVWHTVG